MGEELVKKNKRKVYFFLAYKSITIDWLLVYAIDSLYYADIKGMSFSMISLLTTVFCLSFVIAQIPCIKLVRTMGTANASRLGTFLLFVSTIFLFFDPWAMFVAQALSGVALSMKNLAEPKILKDNLKMFGLSDKYSKYGSTSRFGFAFLTAIGTFAAGFLYEYWVYLPFIIATSILFISVILSLFIKNEKEIYKKQHNLPKHNVAMEKFEYIKLFKYRTTWLLLFFSMIFFALVCCPMDINKMILQQLDFSATTITTICGVAYLIRSFATLGFGYIYSKLKFNSIHIITAFSVAGLLMMGLGGMFLDGIAALLILGIGTTLLYSTKDPFHIVREDFVMNSKGLTKRQTLLSITNIGTYLGRTIMSLIISQILLTQTAAMTDLIILASLVPLAIVISLLLDRKRKVNKY